MVATARATNRRTEMPRNRLELFNAPIQGVVTHGFKQFGGGVHENNSIAGDINCQVQHRRNRPGVKTDQGSDHGFHVRPPSRQRRLTIRLEWGR